MLLVFIAFASMLQPFSPKIYSWSFIILGIGGGIYLVMSYVPPDKGTKRALLVAAVTSLIVVGVTAFAIWIAPILVKISIGP